MNDKLISKGFSTLHKQELFKESHFNLAARQKSVEL